MGSGPGPWTEGKRSHSRDSFERKGFSSERLFYRIGGNELSALIGELTAQQAGEMIGVSRDRIRDALKGRCPLSAEQHEVLSFKLTRARARAAYPEMFLNP